MSIDYNLLGMSMSEIKDEIVDNFLEALEAGKFPLAPMVWGSPGVGKTMTVYAAARAIGKALNTECEVYANATSCLEPTDIAGVPTPVEINGKTRYTAYLAPEWAYRCSDQYEQDMRKSKSDFVAPPAILFFDDIVAAHFQTQTAFFKLVQEGHAGDMRLRKNVMVVAAGNRVEDNAGANDMPTALANRFMHLYANPKPDDWVTWAQTEGEIHPYIVGYVRKNQGDLMEFDAKVASREEKAFASPRSWEALSNKMKGGRVPYTEGSSRFFRVATGLIGHGTATQFLGFLRNTNAVVDPEIICKNPKKAKIPPKSNLSAMHATIASLEAHLLNHPEKWEAGVIYATRKGMLRDFGVILASTIMKIILTKLPQSEQTAAITSDTMTAMFDEFEGIIEAVKN